MSCNRGLETTADEGLSMQTALPVSQEAAAGLLAISEKDGLAMDVEVNGMRAANGVSMGVRAGIRGGAQGGIRGGIRGAASRSRGGLPTPPKRLRRLDARPFRQADEGGSELAFKIETDQSFSIPLDLLIATQEKPPVQPNTDLFTVQKKTPITLTIRPQSAPETPLIVSQVALDPATVASTPAGKAAEVSAKEEDVNLADADGNGVSTLVEVATLVTKGVPVSQAVQIAADPTSELKPTAEDVKAAFTVMGAKLEEKASADLKSAGVTSVETPKIDLSNVDVTPPDTTVVSSEQGAVSSGEPAMFTFTCTKDQPDNPHPNPLPFSPPRAEGEFPLLSEERGRVRSSESGSPRLAASTKTACTYECDLTGPAESFASKACDSPLVLRLSKDGAYTLSVVASDAMGNRDTTPATISFTVLTPAGDTTPPETAISSQPSAISSQTSATFEFTSDDAGATFECKLDQPGAAGTFASCTTPTTQTLSKGDGSYTFSVRAVDKANNRDDTPATFSWTVDPTAPSVAISSQPSAVSNSTSATFKFSSTDATASFACKLDQPSAAGTAASCTSPLTLSLSKGDGSYTFTVQATDSVGNSSTTTYTWTLDTTAPSAIISSSPSSVSGSTSATFAFSSTDTSATFACDMDSGGYSTCTSTTTYTGLSSGSHTFSVKATDTASNTGSAATATWTIDLTGPSAPGSFTAALAASTSISVSYSASTDTGGAGLISTPYIIHHDTDASGSPYASTTTASSSTSATLSSLTSANIYYLSATADDAVGNRSGYATEVRVYLQPNASDGLGHLSGGNMVYTSSAANDGGGTSASAFNTPLGVALDTTNHRLFVADISNHRVLVFNLSTSNDFTGVDRTADNVLGQANFTANGFAATQSGMRTSTNVGYDSTNNRLYVADSDNNRILVFDTSSISDGENAIYVLGQTNFTNSGFACSQSQLRGPRGVAYGANKLYVADFFNHRVIVYNVTSISDGENAANVLGQPDFTTCTNATTQSKMNDPAAVAVDTTNNRLFVGDTDNNRVLVFDIASITDGENAANVLGQSSFTSGTAATTRAGLSAPSYGLAYDSTTNRLFVGDTSNNRVIVFDVSSISDGEDAVNVLGQPDWTTSTAATTQSGMNSSRGVALDLTNNRLFVVEATNHRVLLYPVP